MARRQWWQVPSFHDADRHVLIVTTPHEADEPDASEHVESETTNNIEDSVPVGLSDPDALDSSGLLDYRCGDNECDWAG